MQERLIEDTKAQMLELILDSEAKINSPSTKMAVALVGHPIYEGTVPSHVKAKRRAVGKRQRNARKLHRG